MSVEEKNIAAIAKEQLSLASRQAKLSQSWYIMLRSSLWLCLLLALLIRVWLIYHTHGVIDGDEAMVGIQAEHILRGEHPIYFYGQAYMGSLEAYVMAVLFALGGASVWMLRAEPILLSLLVVYLTWRLAGALAETAQLPPLARQLFQTLAALFAAVPPLYDTVLELRTLGGYIETFVLMLLLLLSALQLTRRWHAGASSKELALRWAGIGFIVGLGFWVNPLLVSAVLATAIWIVVFCLRELVQRKMCFKFLQRVQIVEPDPHKGGHYISKTLSIICRDAINRVPGAGWGHLSGSIRPWGAPPQPRDAINRVPTTLTCPSWKCIAPCGGQAPRTASTFLRQCILVLVALPASMIGAAPALYWGLHNHWANITYVQQLGDLKLLDVAIKSHYHSRLELIRDQIALYQSTIAPHVISGSLPVESTTLTTIHTFTLYVGLTCLVTSLLLVVLSLLWHHSLLLRIRQLISLPLLFAICTAFTFCTSTITSSGLISQQHDLAGRYATPLMLALPFFLATVFTLLFGKGSRVGAGVAWMWSGGPCGRPLVGEWFISWLKKSTFMAGRRSHNHHSTHLPHPTQRAATRAPATHPYHPRPYAIVPLIIQGVLFAILLLYVGAQIATFGLTDADATFQSPSCLVAPASDDSIIAYLQQEHVHYGWADSWLATPIVFNTNDGIILADPHPIIYQQGFGRLPAYTQAVLHADHPAMLTFVPHSDTYPLLLHALDNQHVTYRVRRFPALRGYDVLVVTNLSRNVALAGSRDFAAVFPYCAVYQ